MHSKESTYHTYNSCSLKILKLHDLDYISNFKSNCTANSKKLGKLQRNLGYIIEHKFSHKSIYSILAEIMELHCKIGQLGNVESDLVACRIHTSARPPSRANAARRAPVRLPRRRASGAALQCAGPPRLTPERPLPRRAPKRPRRATGSSKRQKIVAPTRAPRPSAARRRHPPSS